jgi:hypothetical protein
MTSNTQGLFGPGVLIVTRTDIANQTPVNIGFANEFSYDLSGDVKALFGQDDLPLIAASGTKKPSGKMKAATISGLALNSVVWGGTFIAGQRGLAISPVTAIPASPGTLTPTVPSSGTFDKDLGVVDATTRQPFKLVTGTPAAGEYAVNASTGVYTFAAADHASGLSVKISFAYLFTASGGQRLVYGAKPLGQNTTFQIDYFTSLNGLGYYVRFFNAISTKLAMAHKLEDFAMPEIDFSFFTNDAGDLYDISLGTLN